MTRTAPHVLLVDDNLKGVESLDVRLRSLGYRTTTANKGEMAIEVLGRDPAQAVVLDVGMPQMNGYEACRAMRRIAPKMPIIILTGKTEPADRFWAMQSGADAFLNKPIDPAVVVETLAGLLSRS
jgi:DNA-binding response OmpR family regulator